MKIMSDKTWETMQSPTKKHKTRDSDTSEMDGDSRKHFLQDELSLSEWHTADRKAREGFHTYNLQDHSWMDKINADIGFIQWGNSKDNSTDTYRETSTRMELPLRQMLGEYLSSIYSLHSHNTDIWLWWAELCAGDKQARVIWLQASTTHRV